MAKMPPLWLIQGMLKMGMSLPKPEQEPFPDDWDQMTGDEKYAVLSRAFVSTEGRDFESSEIAETYRRRAQRWVDVLALKEPDRIPNFTFAEGYVTQFGGITEKDVWYNSKKSVEAIYKFQKEFNLEYTVRPPAYSGRAFDTLGYSIARWPGSAIAEQALRTEQSFQYVEKEYMTADEYDLLIADPRDYLLTRFIPRTCTNLAGLKDFPSSVFATTVASMAFFLMGFAMGPAKESFKILSRAADFFIQDMMPVIVCTKKIESRYGTPTPIGGMGIAPFDIVGDTLRGTTGVMLDMYRYPDKLVAACDALTPSAIRMATSVVRMGGAPYVFIPLHKGADGFMSTEQFEKFYWPSFREMLLGIIDAGVLPILFVEGSYDQRLEFITENGDLPSGKTAWLFDRTDMKAAKEKIGTWACIGGNVPASLFMSGEPKTMEEYCKEVIDTCAPGGGFFLAPGVVINNAIDENFRTYLASTKKYGVY